MKKVVVLLLVSTFLTVSCQKDGAPDDAVLPSDLVVDISISDQGVADFEANAANANFYSFTINEQGDVTYLQANDGLASYAFTTSGMHEIEVRAHASSNDYIVKIESIEVSIENDANNGPPETGYTSPLSYPGYDLVWSDEFEGNTLSSDWINEIGTGSNGWGNNELQYYLAENTNVANGHLTITAKEQLFGGMNYTSSRLKTQGIQSFQYGRVDISAAMPFGQGIWPALWMLGESFTTVSWPFCGEIDIAEMVGGAGDRNATVHGTIHWEQAGSHAEFGDSYTIDNGILADEWHVYSIIWDENKIEWYIDNHLYNVVDITPTEMSEFHDDFFIILNVAVGGNWPGSPDVSTLFPQHMYVDYVRVFQQ